MVFTVTAMFTKENTITIPFMLLFIELLFFSGSQNTTWKKRLIIFLLLFLTVPIIPATNLVFHGHSQSDPDVTFKASTSMDRMEYFYTQLNVVLVYIRIMLIPINQNFDYSNDFPRSVTIWDNYSYISFAVLLLIVLFGLYCIRRNRLVALGIIWFFTGLAVESSFISIKDVYFEHRLYFPCAGFVMFIIGMVFYIKNQKQIMRASAGKYAIRRPFIALAVVTVILSVSYTALTIRRNYIFSDSIRLWSDVVKKAPNSDRGHSVLATAYLNAYDEKLNNTEMLEKAEEEFKKAISLNYDNSTAHTNLGKVYYYMGRYDKCIEESDIALSMSRSQYACHNKGLAYKKLGMVAEAINSFLQGYSYDNKSTFIIRSLGDTYYEIKDYKNARFYYEEYLKYSRSGDRKDVKARIEEINSLIKEDTARLQGK